MSKVNISIEQLFELGAHFGHRKRFWNPHMEDYIFCEKNNIHIIDLYKPKKKSSSFTKYLESSRQLVIKL